MTRLKYLDRVGEFPSGNPRFYFRPPGGKRVPMPDLPRDDPKFLKAYAAAAAGRPEPTRGRSAPGSIAAGVAGYLNSEHYLTLATSTRGVWRRALDDIRARYGRGLLADLRPAHIRKDLAPLAAHAANNRLKVWRAFCRWALDMGLTEIDAARDVRPRPTPTSDGFTPWTRADVAAFRARWPIGTAQRLAFEIMHHTGAAIGDACAMGDHNLKDSWIVYTRAKSRTIAASPFTGGPDWFEPSDDLRRALDARPARHLLWLTTAAGAPRSPKAARQWFAAAARAAGIEGKTAHGIRKHRAQVFRENGATPDQRMAILGHDTSNQEAHYSKAADLRRIIARTDLPNTPDTFGKTGEKT
jgi:integrase